MVSLSIGYDIGLIKLFLTRFWYNNDKVKFWEEMTAAFSSKQARFRQNTLVGSSCRDFLDAKVAKNLIFEWQH